ncbi:T9SS type A sorting domain-containing protein [Candidatus Marinimicrobia bacterium]|nr:T9SS type A sorting domain-containing protein [Candidatus Neomarinimicrobiota bacterium]
MTELQANDNPDLTCIYVGDNVIATTTLDENQFLSDIPCNNDPINPEDLGVFFSEYGEGSLQNKYLEIYNAGPDEVNLHDFFIGISNNAHQDGDNPQIMYEYSYPLDIIPSEQSVLAVGGVFVISKDNADELLQSKVNFIYPTESDEGAYEPSPLDFNGNDFIGLFYKISDLEHLIDAFGKMPSSIDRPVYDIAGVEAAAKDHTLVRKSNVERGNTDWEFSSGTTQSNSEWLVLDVDTWEYIGTHLDPIYQDHRFPQLTNRGFENYTLSEEAGIHVLDRWVPWPDNTHYATAVDGENIHESEALFTPYSGNASAKMWTLNQGSDAINYLTETYTTVDIPVGTELNLSAFFWQHEDDLLVDADNSESETHAVLRIAFHDADWNWKSEVLSEKFSSADRTQEWTFRDLNATIPEGTEIITAGVMLVGGTSGAVYFDDISMSLDVPEKYDITFNYDLTNQAPSLDGVHLAGNFQDPNYDGAFENNLFPLWDPAGIEMFDHDQDGIFTVTLNLFPGEYEFKYINGNSWDNAELLTSTDDCTVSAGNNDYNRYVNLVDQHILLDPVCTSMCVPCQDINGEPEFTFLGEFEGNMYYVSDYSSTWEDANTFLEDNFYDAHLVTINSLEENEFISSTTESIPSIWIGASDAVEEGVWTWVTGEEFNFTSWAPGQPDNNNGLEHYANTNHNSVGHWNDGLASISRRFIVEVEYYENYPPSNFSLLTPETNSVFTWNDQGVEVALNWEISEDNEQNVHYQVELEGHAVVGHDTLIWSHDNISNLFDNTPMQNTSFEDPLSEDGGWVGWAGSDQTINLETIENNRTVAVLTSSGEMVNNYLIQIKNADEFREGPQILKAQVSSHADNILSNLSDNVRLYVMAWDNWDFAQENEVYSATSVPFEGNTPGLWETLYLGFELPEEAVAVHIGVFYTPAEGEVAKTVYVDDFELFDEYTSTNLILDEEFFTHDLERFIKIPNLVREIEYNVVIKALDGMQEYGFEGGITYSNYNSFTINNIKVDENRDYYVSIEGSNINGDGTQENPLRDIQPVIEVINPHFTEVANEKTIFVGPGIYHENLYWIGKKISIIGINGSNETILDGGLKDNVVRITNVSHNQNNPELFNYFKGFTVRNGKAISENGFPYAYGSGINLMGSNLIVSDIIVENNDGGDASFFIRTSSSLIENTTIRNNLNSKGITLSANGAYPSFVGVTVEGHNDGPAIFAYDTGVLLESCVIQNNFAGGILYSGVGFAPSIIKSTLFANNGNPNTVTGAINLGSDYKGGDITIEDGIFYMNKANENIGSDIWSNGQYFNDTYQGNDILVKNTVFVSNRLNNKSVFLSPNSNFPDELTIENSTFFGSDPLIAEANNIILANGVHYNVDPLFCDPEGNEFSVAENTPLIDFSIPGTLMGATEIGCGPTYRRPNSISISSFNTEPFENENYIDLGEFQDGHYFLSVGSSTWEDANNLISGINGASLAAVTSSEENEFLSQFVTNAWIGLRLENSNEFSWTTGEDLVYTNWLVGEPNNSGGNEPYVHLCPDGSWNDHTPSQILPFIIEVKTILENQLITNEDTPLNISLNFNPFQQQEYELSLLGDGLGVSIDHVKVESGFEVTITSEQNLNGEFDFSFVITDDLFPQLTDTLDFHLSILPVNDTPEIISFSEGQIIEFNEDTSFEFDIELLDVDAGDELLLSAALLNSGDEVGPEQISVFSLNGTELLITPSDNWNGELLLELTVTDTELATDFISIPVKIQNTNDAPNTFTLSSPDHESEVLSLTPNLEWVASLDIDPMDTVRYEVSFGSSILDLQTYQAGTLTAFTLDYDLEDNTTYYWKVIASDLSDASIENTGGYQSFKVNTENDLPGDFTTLTPELGSMVTDLTPTLMWEEPTDADDASSVSTGVTPGLALQFTPNTLSRNSRYVVSYDVYVNTVDVFDGVTPVTVSETHYTPEVDLSEDAMYYWKVVATDDDGGQTESNMSSFWTNSENSIPTEVVLLTPDSEAETGLAPTFSWTASTDADLEDHLTYQLTYQSSLEDVIHVELGAELTYTPEVELMDNTDYVWQVVVTDQSGATYTTPLQSFRVNTENDNPEGFVLISPIDGSYTSDFNQLLVWSPSNDIDNDFIQFEVKLNGELFAMTENNYIHLYDLMEDMVYEWSVVAMDDNGGSTESEMWSFTVNAENAPPSDFTLITPLPDSLIETTEQITFEWERSEDMDPLDAVMYHLEIHTEESQMMYETSEQSFTVESLTDNHVYHWSVKAMDLNGAMTENVGGPSMFIVNTMNDAPTMSELVAPLDGSIQTDLSPNFYWTVSDDIDPMDHVSYSMSWWGMDDMEVQSVSLDSNGVTPEEDLMDNSMYGWSVEAMDMNEATALTETAYFYTDAFPEAPANFMTLAPENDAAGLGTEVTFVWNATTDPDPIETISYQLVYSEDWMDSTAYIFSEMLDDTSVTMILEDNMEYFWKVLAKDSDGFIVGSNENTPNILVIGTLSLDGEMLPTEFTLHQNYPNPFNPTTQIKYALPKRSLVNITIYDVMGRIVKNLVNSSMDAGYHSLTWDATNNSGEGISAGMYIYTIQAGEYRSTKKMVLLK